MPLTIYIDYKEKLITLTLLVFLPLVVMLLLIFNYSDGEFTYTLDDPYIHLALAKNIWMGNYGINMTELSAPSSSILWPFLLAPFSFFSRFYEIIPLIINTCCLGSLVLVIDRIFYDLKFSVRLLVMAIILLSLNAYGLVFTGMEHSLQILLVALIMLPVLGKLGHVQGKYLTPDYCFLALILLALVRYEGLAISLPILFYLYTKTDEKKKVIFTLSVLVILMISFSIFLKNHGLGFLPSSIIAKSSHEGLTSIIKNLAENFAKYGFLLLPLSIVVMYFWDKDRQFSLVILFSTFLHFLLGKFGWFGRYESYYLLFVVLICLRLIVNMRFRVFPAILFLPFMFVSLVAATIKSPLASSNIYNQQVQMAKISKILAEPIAVNDLGLVALRSNQYVLDLWGLGSIDALRLRKTSTNSDWMRELMDVKHVNYAFIYDSWFLQKPNNWIKVGELKLLEARITSADNNVALYATDEVHAEKLSSVLKEFSKEQNSSNKFSVRLTQ